MKSAILITYDKESISNESAALAKAADFNVVYTIKKKFLNKPKYGISDLTELKTACDDLNPDIIIFDSILSPRKNYNLAGALGKPIFDREMLILNIFEARANTTENQLQVKMGFLKHEMMIAKDPWEPFLHFLGYLVEKVTIEPTGLPAAHEAVAGVEEKDCRFEAEITQSL